MPAFSVAGTALLVVALAAPYSISQFLRNAISVVAPNLAAEFSLAPSEVGLLAAIFFFSFALVQIPLGAFIDVRGPKQAILIGIAFVIAGSAAFSLADGRAGLIAGRLLAGAGCGAFYMCALTVYARNFETRHFSTIAGFQLAIGNLGTLAATAPLAWAVAEFGWRGSFGAVGVFALVAAAGILLVVPRDPVPEGRKLAWAEAFRGLGAVTKVPEFWPIFAMHAISVATFVTIAGLWAGPWLTDVYGYDLAGRGRMLLIPAVTQIIGVFVIGASDRWMKSYRDPVIACAAAVALLLLVAAFAPLPRAVLPVWLALFGFFISFTPVLTAHGRVLFSAGILGRGLTLLNFGVMAGAFLMQLGAGLIVQLVAGGAASSYPPAAYSAVFASVAVVIAATLLTYGRTTNRHPSKSS